MILLGLLFSPVQGTKRLGDKTFCEPTACDIDMSGLPCQPWSPAGRQKGKTRGIHDKLVEIHLKWLPGHLLMTGIKYLSRRGGLLAQLAQITTKACLAA